MPRALSLLLTALALAAPAAPAQDLPAPGDGFDWERVGDVPIDVFDLTFGPDSTLWATGSRGPYRLDLSSGSPGTWVLLYDSGSFSGPILPLGRGPEGDTLVSGRRFATRRSVDGGATWTQVHNDGGGGLYEVPAGYPYAGRILTGADDGQPRSVAYSDDRGATFTEGTVPDNGAPSSAEAFVALPPGSSHPGRILAAGRWGVTLSDDWGATFTESGLHEVLYYVGEGIGLVEGPGGGVVAVMAGRVSAQAHRRAWTSADGGETWGPDPLGVPLPEGPPTGIGGAVAGVFPLGGASALLVLGRGTVYRTDDAGATWAAVGRAPEINENRSVESAALGPDGRLYVGLHATGTERGWVWRTAEVVSVAAEPAPAPPAGEPLGVAVHPNPMRGTARVTFEVGEAAHVRVAAYDVLGREVAVLHEGPVTAGRHEQAWDGSALPAGVYVVRVAAGDAVAAERVTLVR